MKRRDAVHRQLRMELKQESAPVSVTLIKPAAIDTMYPEHARTGSRARPGYPSRSTMPGSSPGDLLCRAEAAPQPDRRRWRSRSPPSPRPSPGWRTRAWSWSAARRCRPPNVPSAPGTSEICSRPPRRSGRGQPAAVQAQDVAVPSKRRCTRWPPPPSWGSVAAGALFLWAKEENRDIGTAEAHRRIRAAGMSSVPQLATRLFT